MLSIRVSSWMLALLLSFPANPAPSQSPADFEANDPNKKSAIRAGDVDVRFLDGSNLHMNLKSATLDVQTDYGKLTIPIEDIKQIEFGVHISPDLRSKIDALILELGSGDFRKRDQAVKNLVELKHFAYLPLKNVLAHKDAEVKRRAADAIEKLKSDVSEKFLKLSDEDRIVTRKFTAIGKILTPTLKAKNEYFGELDLHIHQILALRSLSSAGDANIALEAGKYAVPGTWYETEIELKESTKLVTTATGMIDQWPQTPGQYMVGPQGIQQLNGWQRNQVVDPMGRRIIGKGQVNNLQQYSGCLLGKIGVNGPILYLSDSYQAVPGAEGKLYLCIGPSHWGNSDCTGSYRVHVRIEE